MAYPNHTTNCRSLPPSRQPDTPGMPSTVSTIPSVVMRRMQWFPQSATKMLPSASQYIWLGLQNCAFSMRPSRCPPDVFTLDIRTILGCASFTSM